MSALYLFRAGWPIVHPSTPFAGLLEQATSELGWLIRQAHAQITGEATWRIVRTVTVPGFGRSAELLLLWEAPAVRVARRTPGTVTQVGYRSHPGDRARSDVDPVVVDRILAGERVSSTPAEKRLAMGAWTARGGSERELCEIQGWRPGRYISRPGAGSAVA